MPLDASELKAIEYASLKASTWFGRERQEHKGTIQKEQSTRSTRTVHYSRDFFSRSSESTSTIINHSNADGDLGCNGPSGLCNEVYQLLPSRSHTCDSSPPPLSHGDAAIANIESRCTGSQTCCASRALSTSCACNLWVWLDCQAAPEALSRNGDWFTIVRTRLSAQRRLCEHIDTVLRRMR